MKIPLLTAVLLLAAPSLSQAEAPPKRTAQSSWQVIQKKDCGYRIRFRKGTLFEMRKGCVLKLTLPPIPGQGWVQEASLNLEVTAAANGEATESPVDGEPATGTLVAGGLKFSKSTLEDSAAGHTHVTVSYTAVGKSHQYHFLGILNAVDPAAQGKPSASWNPSKSAEKIFDGLVLNFRALE